LINLASYFSILDLPVS